MIRIAMKPIPFLLMMAIFAATLVAEEPKASSQRSAEEINKEIEALQKKIKALDEEKALQRKASDTTVPAKPETRSSEPRVVGNIKTSVAKGQKILVTPAHVGVITKDIELHGIDYMTPRMSMEMAERHSAEKIKAQVQEADAKARRILNGNPPSQVHGD